MAGINELWPQWQIVRYLNSFLRGESNEVVAVYDDLRIPANTLSIPAASAPDFDGTNGCWLFDNNTTEEVFMQIQFPHGWKQESDITPHLHWQKTTSASGNVYWQLDYKWAPINEVMDSGFTTLSTTSTVAGTPDTDTADLHLISSFGDITTSGRQISDMLVMKLSRIGGDAADTYGADARLLEFDIRIQYNSIGSDGEFTKT